MMKLKVLLKITRSSIWWKWKYYQSSRGNQDDESKSVISDHKWINMMKLKVLLMIRRRSIWRKWKCQQGSHFVAGSCCGVMMIADRQMTSFVFICSTMVMMSMIIIVMMYDDHCDDVWWSLWWYMMLLPQRCRSWFCFAQVMLSVLSLKA